MKYPKVLILTSFTPFASEPYNRLAELIDTVPMRQMKMVRSNESCLRESPINNVIFTLCMHEGNYKTTEDFSKKLTHLLEIYSSQRIIVVIADSLDRYNRDPVDTAHGDKLIKQDKVLQEQLLAYQKVFYNLTHESAQKHLFLTWDDFVKSETHSDYLQQYLAKLKKQPDIENRITKV